jgi:nucleoside phosphorylase
MKVKADILLVTVNEYETQALLQVFQEATGNPVMPILIDERVYRDLGTVNGMRVFHALSEMGSGGIGATQQTVDKGIRAVTPRAVIGVGIAFGINEKKQAIGDILLSRQLRLYDLQRVGSEIILRGDKPHASTRLINFFEGVAQTSWKGARVRSGVILTGDKLVDNLDYRTQLIGFEPEAVGGEMEGAGLYVASQDHKIDWIIIKAICDWGDGQKAKNKVARQKRAARSAAEFVLHALQQLPLMSIPETRTASEDYSGYWVYEIINEHWMVEVYAAMYLTIDSTTHLATARGKVWKKGKSPDPKDYFGEWDSEPFLLQPEMTNMFFNFICYEEYEEDEKLRIPQRTHGVVRIRPHRDILEGNFKDFEPEREGYGSFRAVRTRKPANSLEEAGKEAWEVFGMPSKRYADWLACITTDPREK